MQRFKNQVIAIVMNAEEEIASIGLSSAAKEVRMICQCCHDLASDTFVQLIYGYALSIAKASRFVEDLSDVRDLNHAGVGGIAHEMVCTDVCHFIRRQRASGGQDASGHRSFLGVARS